MVLKNNMFAVVIPLYRPTSFLHADNEFITTGGFRDGFHNGDGTFCYKASLGVVGKQIVFVLAPSGNLTLLDNGTIKVATFFSNGESSFKAKGIGKFFLFFQIPLGLVKLQSVDVGHTVGYNVAVQVIFILVYSDNTLMVGEELFTKLFADFEHLLRCDLFIFVKGYDVVGIHPAGVFIPQFLFTNP